METKVLEIQHSGQKVPVMVVRLDPASKQEQHLFVMAGYGFSPDVQREYFLMVEMKKMGGANIDPFSWKERTLQEAHNYIRCNWLHVRSGDTIDLDYILSS